MTFEFLSIDEAIARPGLRMVVVPGLSVGWNDAARNILHVKRLDWAGVRLDYQSERLRQWAGQRSGPIVIYERERPRTGWSEILMLAERLAPTPSLVPEDPEQRADMFGLAHELCAEAGLGWARRLQLVHAGLQGTGGFPEPIARYLGKKYGYHDETGPASGARVAQLLCMLAARLKAQRTRGSRYYIGEKLTAADVYSASFIAMFSPLAHAQCPDPNLRAAFETLDAETQAALDPILLEHRARMYAEHLALPLAV